jgi:hypothetical protein
MLGEWISQVIEPLQWKKLLEVPDSRPSSPPLLICGVENSGLSSDRVKYLARYLFLLAPAGEGQ